ncbi:MAG: TDP-N-acetylfucosamine:lipid II N-acetylfucosaminyltransferase [Oscillospiraceae bacterium]|nr:TDP-N-acetylfucosamine:lipid II N-acetylfucosaminyltransferase [Oscillospiraceae bacterium]
MADHLHILGTGNIVAKVFPAFLAENFPVQDHSFLIVGDKYDRSEFPENTTLIKTFRHAAVMAQIKQHEHTLIHGMSISTYTKVCLLLQPKYLRRIVWVAWGADLYPADRSHSLKARISGLIDFWFKKSIKNFVGIFEPDIRYFRKRFGSRANTFFAKYASGSETRNPIYLEPPFLQTIADKRTSGAPVTILVGHQSNPLLDHCTVIDRLARFTGENIHVIIPLSYGDAAHAETVGRYAESVLADKVTVLRDFMSQKEYMDILKNIDIAIFHIDRQIGLGNIYPLMYMQKKLYMKSSGVMYGHFRTDGIDIQPSELLEDISFEELVRDVDMSAATDYVVSLQDTAANVTRWRHVFEALDGQRRTV